MKKLFVSLIALLFVLLITITSAARENIYTINDVTIVFSETSSLSDEQKALISHLIINGTDNSSTTYNLMCTLFGHNTATENISVIEHCVNDTPPRCRKTVQDVTMCTRCEELIDTHIITSYYINCCE
ncbi:MAG: hypothetical protein IJB43_01790 [Clostridia bacterium]|nr:hypothetical protein [Clostridia bacterium]